MTESPSRLIIWVLAAALIAAACGSSTQTTETETAASTATSPSTSTSTSAGTDPSGETDSSGDSPTTLEDYLGPAAGRFTRSVGLNSGRTGGGFENEEFIAEQQLIQLGIQRCMQAQGFTYVPEEATGRRFFAAAEDTGLSDLDYAETRGFGISTRFDSLLAGDIEIDETPNPNDEHLATLSEAEAEAWQLALRGQPPERNDEGQLIDPETGEPIEGGPGRLTGGCQGESQVAVRGDLSQLADLNDEFEALEDRIDADPRLTEINREWSDCMGEAGFAYADQAEAEQDFESRFQPLVRSFVQAAQGQGNTGGGRGPGGGGLIEALITNGLSDEQEQELRQLQDLEIAAAVASHECTGDTDDEVAEILARYEADFVAENRATLEAIAG